MHRLGLVNERARGQILQLILEEARSLAEDESVQKVSLAAIGCCEGDVDITSQGEVWILILRARGRG